MSMIPDLTTTAEQRVVLGNVSWGIYLALVEEAGNPRGRLTYDQGDLEIMSPSLSHERISRLIGRMIEMYTFQKGIEILSSRSTTFKQSRRQQGFEADESYYIQHAAQMQGVSEVDMKIHPPPDLVIEVDISRSSELKMRVFAGLGIEEVWRHDGERLAAFLLKGETYESSAASRALPDFPLERANQLLARRDELGEQDLVRRFVEGM